MELKNILAINGKPGLYKLISNSGSRLIVESISEGKKVPISASSKISALEDIAIFTFEEDVPLTLVFDKMFEDNDGKEGLSHKDDPSKLREGISKILSDLDHERVYDSDLKKLYQWYNLLLASGQFEVQPEEDVKEEEVKEDLKAEDKAEESEKEA